MAMLVADPAMGPPRQGGLPIMIGARDMAFPKMNAFAFWLLIPSAVLMFGSFFTVGQPIANIERLNEVNPNGPFYSSNVAAPQIRQPFTSQTSVGWSHQLSTSMVFDVDYVHVEGRDLGHARVAVPVPQAQVRQRSHFARQLDGAGADGLVGLLAAPARHLAVVVVDRHALEVREDSHPKRIQQSFGGAAGDFFQQRIIHQRHAV